VSALRGRFVSVWREVYQIAQAEGAVTSSGVPLAQDDRFLDADGRSWTVREAVTLASLIERETSRSSERAIVSAVYRNRLRKGMRLECDPTVQYALGVWKQPLFRKDLTVDSPYNTYRHRGLPPHPICSPGRASLEASLSPAKASWLYFVSDARGGHRFSATYADHRASVRLYRNTLKFLKKPVQ